MFRKLNNYYAIPVSNLNLNEFIDTQHHRFVFCWYLDSNDLNFWYFTMDQDMN